MCRATVGADAHMGLATTSFFANPVDPSLKEDLFVANIKSQIKRNRTNEKARLRNKETKSAIKTATRKFHEALESGDAAEIQETARAAGRQLDKAASKGTLHKNQAANHKSAIFSAAASA
jgi:small subunit ribosomal protein S20